MTRRQRAFWMVTVPVAAMLAMNDRIVGAQEPTAQPMASRSGIELGSLDKTADPCNDFYQFACGGWLASHPAPADQPRYGRFEALQERNNAILRDILEEAAKPSSGADMRKIGDYYASCLDQKTIESKGLAPLQPELDRVAAIKSAADIPAGCRPPPHARLRSLLRLRRRAGLQGRDAVHRDVRSGRSRASRSRLLREGRCELGEAAGGSTSST